MTLVEQNDFSLEDERTVNSILGSVANDNLTSYRFRTVVKMNPYMATNPAAVATMASMPIPTVDLARQAGALYGMQAADSLAQRLPNYQPSTQRAIFGTLSRAQQQTLRAMGYEPPSRDIHDDGFFEKALDIALKPAQVVFGGIGRAVSPVVSPALGFMSTVGDIPFKAYRTVTQLDGTSQWLAGLTALGTTVAGLALFIPSGGTSSALVAAGLTAGRIGLASLAGVAAGTGVSLASSAIQNGNTKTWMDAWNASWNGERLFNQNGIKRAAELLGDPNLVNIAKELAEASEKPGDLLDIAKQVAGTRGADNPLVQSRQLAVVAEQFAKPGTPAYQAAYKTLNELLTMPAFQEAVSILERSKISMGRDISRLFGLDPSTGAGRWLSGSIDAASMFLLDPFLIAGGLTRAAAQARRGLMPIDGISGVERFRQVAALPEMQRKFAVVARAVQARDMSLLNRGAREYRPIFDKLVFNAEQLAEQGIKEGYSAQNVVDFLVGTDQLKSVIRGIGVVPGVSLGQMRGLNKGQYLWAQATGGARDVIRGIADIGLEGNAIERALSVILRNPEFGPQYADMLANVSQSQVDSLIGMGLSENAARVVARYAMNLPARVALGVADESLEAFAERTGSLFDETWNEAKMFLENTLANSSTAYNAGRILGNIPIVGNIVRPFASLVEGLTTRTLTGGAAFQGLNAAEDVNSLVELFKNVGMPSYVRNMWKNAILLSPTGGARIAAITSLLDSVATGAGFRLTKAGNDIIDTYLERSRQFYSMGPLGRYALDGNGLLDLPMGVRPLQDMATMMAMPDLHMIRKATQQGYLLRGLLGISESVPVLAFQNKFWKPAVLLRVGFIMRNLAEESLSMVVRYGTGHWANEFVSRQVAKRVIFDDIYNKSLRKNQNVGMDKFKEHVLRNRWDVPVGFRTLARGIERIESGQSWLKMLDGYTSYLDTAINYTSQRFYDWAILGYGGVGAQALRRAAAPITKEGVNATLRNMAKRLAFGNPYSLRRMLIGGANIDLVNYAIKYEVDYGPAMLQQIGTTNLAPWDRDRFSNITDRVERLIVDPNGDETVQLVNVLSERDITTASRVTPNVQPHGEAVLARRQELLDDAIVDATLDPVRILYNSDVQLTPGAPAGAPDGIDATNLQKILSIYAERAFGKKVRWDDDILHLWLIVHEGIFNRRRFDIRLRAMTFTDEQIEEMSSEALQQWAVRRNEMVKLIRTAFPGQTQPTWKGIVEAILGDDTIAKHLDEEFVYTRANPNFVEVQVDEMAPDFGRYPEYQIVDETTLEGQVDVTGVPLLDILPGRAGFSKLRTQLAPLTEMSELLGDAPLHAREWTRMLIYNWHRDPTLLNPANVFAWNPAGGVRKRPTFEAYMGKEYGGWEVDDEGNLILDLTPRHHAPESLHVSMSLDKSQALKYSVSQVKPVSGQRAPVLFTFDGDALLASQGMGIDDLVAGSFQAGDVAEGQDIAAIFLNRPKAPFVGREIEMAGRRELVLAKPRSQGVSPFPHIQPLSLTDIAENFKQVEGLRGIEAMDALTAAIDTAIQRLVGPIAAEVGEETLPFVVKRRISRLSDTASADEVQEAFRNLLDSYVSSSWLKPSDYADYFWADILWNLRESVDLFPSSISQRILDYANWLETGAGTRATVVIPRGAWSIEPVTDPLVASTSLRPDVERALSFSTPLSYSPFYSTLDEALPAMRFKAGEAMTDPRYADQLKLSPRWHQMPETTPVYIVDTRTIRDLNPAVTTSKFDDLDENPAVEVFVRYGLATERNLPVVVRGELQDEAIKREVAVSEFLTAAISEQQPIIVGSQELAEHLADAIGEYVAVSRGLPFTSLSRRPAVGKAYFPTKNKPLPGFSSYPLGYTLKDQRKTGEIFGWDASNEFVDNYENFPLVWDWIDSLKQEVGPTEMVDAMIEYIVSNVRAGRRVVRSVRETDNVPTLYRNVMGEPVELMPGEIIEGDDLIYTSPDFKEGTLVRFGDQRYFENRELSYEGNNEVLWSVMAPVLADHAESGLGWRLYDLKNPVELAPIGSRRKQTIYTSREHVRSASAKHVALTNVGDLPDWEIVQTYRPYVKKRFEDVVNFGFNRIVSPTIDALTRKPMGFHAFVLAAQRNKALTSWLIEGSVQERALQQTIIDFQTRLPESIVTTDMANRWGEFGRLVGRVHGDQAASNWDDVQAITYLRGFDEDEFNELFGQVGYWLADRPDQARSLALLDFAKKNQPQLQLLNPYNDSEGFLHHIDRVFGKGSALEGRPMLVDSEEARKTLDALTNSDWRAIKLSANQRKNHEDEILGYAAEHAIRDTMPFVDSHEIRSQFAEFGRGLLPFWYAEENFLKRWAKMFAQGGPAVTLERVRKLQLTYMGLKTVGIVRTDSQGRDYFVYPGSELLATAIEKVYPGQMLPISALLQTPTERMIPGFTRDFGRPSVGPFVAIGLDAITTGFPELRSLEETFVGKEFAFGGISDIVVPAHINNVWNALGDLTDSDLTPSNDRVASAVMAAIAHMDANDQGLEDDATPGEVDEYLRRVRDHARIIVFSQALAGFFTPGPAQMLQLPEGGSLSWITDGKITDPADLLSSTYYELVSELGIEAGTQQFLALNKNARIHSVLNPLAYTVSKTRTPSGAPLPTTDKAMEFYFDNESLLGQYPDAGPWLLPQSDNQEDKRSQWAYDSEMISNLRERRTPEEFIMALKYKEGANVYFASQKIYERSYQALRVSGQDEKARNLNRLWLQWADAFRANHPIFSEMLTSDDARQRRRRVIDQMRYVLKDPEAPKADHFDALKILQDSYDTYSVARGELALDRSTRGEVALSGLKLRFRSWVEEFLINNPKVLPYWTTILEPESGLE